MTDSESVEIALLLDAILHKYGYDFHAYAEASFRRRIARAVTKYQCQNVAGLLHRILTDPEFFTLLLEDLTVTVSEMFRDPLTYKAIRERVISYLKTYPEIKIWFAGCAGGEEVYSMAILLKEEGLYDRSLLYGTDINLSALQRAREGILDANHLKDATKRYFDAGGTQSLASYYTIDYGAALPDRSLKQNMVFSDHNLASDGVFGEMQLIFCRNALIYFKRELHDRAIGLFKDSLCPGGFLCLGSKESLSLSGHRRAFEDFLPAERIYRKQRA